MRYHPMAFDEAKKARQLSRNAMLLFIMIISFGQRWDIQSMRVGFRTEFGRK